MLAPVAVAPLGLRLVPLSARRARRLLRAARLLQPFGAVLVIASFLVPAGRWAALLAAGWLAVCAIAGLAGASELVESRSIAPGHLLPAAAVGFLAVGAGWLVAARGGISLGYSAPIVELTAVKGLGVWSAHMFLMFHLERPDVMPVGDLGIRRAIQLAYGLQELPGLDEMIAHAEPWRPHRTLACRYLWRSLHNEPT